MMINIGYKILYNNLKEHMKEAKYYDIIHTELFNWYEQKRILNSLKKATANFDLNSIILDIGTGTGNLTIKLLRQGFKNITCVEELKANCKLIETL